MGAYRIESLQTEHVIVSTTADKAGERVLIEPSTTPFDRTVRATLVVFVLLLIACRTVGRLHQPPS